MRRLVSIAPAVVILGIATMALAAVDRHVSADFTPLASSSVAGKVSLAEQKAGVISQLVLKGLQPNTEYIARFYLNHNCETEAATPQNVLASFAANRSGMATAQSKIATTLDQIGSVSISLASDPTVVIACASIQQ